MTYCENCGKQIENGSSFCGNCGAAVAEQVYQAQYMPQHPTSYQPLQQAGYQQPPVVIQQPPVIIMTPPTIAVTGPRVNSVGLTGLILASIAIFVSCVPVFGWVCWLSGLILSIVGLSKEPRGTAVAGLIISLVNLMILVFLVGALVGLINELSGLNW
jgi:hypothetical protein